MGSVALQPCTQRAEPMSSERPYHKMGNTPSSQDPPSSDPLLTPTGTNTKTDCEPNEKLSQTPKGPSSSGDGTNGKKDPQNTTSPNSKITPTTIILLSLTGLFALGSLVTRLTDISKPWVTRGCDIFATLSGAASLSSAFGPISENEPSNIHHV